MKPENYIKKHILKNKNILFYSLIYIKQHKTLYYFDIEKINNNDINIKILNKSNKNNIIDCLKDMFIFKNNINNNYDYQEIKLQNKLNIETNEIIGIPILGYQKINGKQKLIFIQNYYKDNIIKI